MTNAMTSQEIAEAFKVDQNRVMVATFPAPLDLEALAPEIAAYDVARGEFNEAVLDLESAASTIEAARQRDRAAVTEAARAGKPVGALMSKELDAEVARLAAAKVLADDAGQRMMDAMVVVLYAVQDRGDEIASETERKMADLADLARPYQRALEIIGQHQQNALSAQAWADGTPSRSMGSMWFANYTGRNPEHIEALPEALKRR